MKLLLKIPITFFRKPLLPKFFLRLSTQPVRAAPDPVVVWKAVYRSNGGEGVVLVVDDVGGGGLDVVGGDGIDAGEGLGQTEAAAVREELAADVLGNVSVTVEGHEHVGLELGLGALDLRGVASEASRVLVWK